MIEDPESSSLRVVVAIIVVNTCSDKTINSCKLEACQQHFKLSGCVQLSDMHLHHSLLKTYRELLEALFALLSSSAYAREGTTRFEDLCCEGKVGSELVDDGTEEAVLHIAPWHCICSMWPNLYKHTKVSGGAFRQRF